ncbi:hypothetical protein BLNAU_21238 [Blattamonas nauphoetae]|uniref:Protein kinase domain-containing protein n=1 Tax=Blattamonas nauphoetae TaxID=2049346 RepID=A0ABQ9WWG4_9EUKA|nr:hypothetical protein BLNAU_21238 [Blattamonas nauphoetae]
MTSTKSKQLIPPKRLSQTCIGVSVSHSVGALQNTIIQDHNLGSSLLCQNSTFTSCQSTAASLTDALIASTFAPLLSEYLAELKTPYNFTDAQYTDELSHLYWSITELTSITSPIVYNFATASTPVTYTNCSFIHMKEDTSDNFGYGGVALRHMCQAPLTITNCSFEDCRSERGRFDRCSSVGQGGAISVWLRSITKITHSSFTQCGATDFHGTASDVGGGLYAMTCSVSFSEFVSNTATSCGGIAAGQSASLVFCHFADNNAEMYRDFNRLYPFDSIAAVIGCTESGDPFSSTDEVLFVESGGTGLDCSYSSPCGSLSSALSKVGTSQTKLIKVEAGSYETVTIVDSSCPTITQSLSKDAVEIDNQVLSFSLKVDVHTDLELKGMHLCPIPGLALLTSSCENAYLTQFSQGAIWRTSIYLQGSLSISGSTSLVDYPILAQSERPAETLFTLRPSSSGSLYSLRLLTITQHTDPMIVVEEEASLTFSDCIVSSDGTTSQRSIVRSRGEIIINGGRFVNLNFEEGSCFETFGGSITIQRTSLNPVVSNLTTTDDGAFINSLNTSLCLDDIILFNCCATNGGAVFVRDSPSIHINIVVFGCSASQNGGGVCIEGVGSGDYPAIELSPSFFVNCSAVNGGGLFINISNYFNIHLGGGGETRLPFVDTASYLSAFSGCSAQKGAGLFLDGSDMRGLMCQFGVLFSNDDCVCEGSDLFVSQSAADSHGNLGDYLSGYFASMTSFSGRSMDENGLFKHVEVGGHPELSRNFPPPMLQVIGSNQPPDETCISPYSLSCSSIHMYLPLFHTKTDNGGYLPIPIYLSAQLFFFESGVVRKQSTVVKMQDVEGYEKTDQVDVQLGQGEILYFTPFLEVAEEGSLEFSKIEFVWRIDHSLCHSLDPSAKIAITECNFKIHTNITVPLITCACGSLTIKQTSFTTPATTKIASPLITSFLLSAAASNSELNLRIEMSHVTFQNVTMDVWVNCVVFIENPDWMKLDHVNFENVTKAPTEIATRMIVHGRNLASVIQCVEDSGFPQRGGDVDTLYESLDEAEPEDSPLLNPTLLLYLSPFRAPTVIVKSTGRDGVWCGDDTFPCASLDESDWHLNGPIQSTIAIVDVAQLNSEVDLTPDKTTIVSKGGSKVTVAVSTDGSLVNKADTITHSLALESLLFSLTSDRSVPLIQSRSGMLTISVCSFVSSSPLSSKLIEVSGGTFKLTDVELTSVQFSVTLLTFSNFESVKLSNVDHKSCSSGSLMTFEGSSDLPQIELRDCVFSGPSTSPSQNDDSLCAWPSSLVVVNSCSFDSYSSSFSHLSQGALHVLSSKAKIVGGQMTDNNPHSSSFPNMNRNIRCEGASSIELDTSPSDSDTLWINTDSDCVVKGNTGSEVLNSFFVPTLTPTSCSATFTKKTKEYSIVMKGTLLIPCGLAFVISDVANTNAQPFRIPLSAETTSELTESSITMTLHSNDLNELEAKNEWFRYLAFGQTGKTDSFTFKLSQKQAQSLAMQKTLPWLIPLIVSLVVLILLALLIIFCCRRRKTQNTKEMSEMNEQESVPIEDEKMEVLDPTQVNLHAVDQLESVTKSSIVDSKHSNNITSPPFQESHVEALVCTEKLEISVVREMDTLYNALHVNEQKRTFPKRAFQRQLALGLTTIAVSNKQTDILTKLSSHWVMFDAQGNACLKSQEPTQQIPFQQSSGGTQPVTASKDGQRWKAPEVVKAEEEKDFRKVIDERKAAVFSLGLVLWEIETGLVPFGELDAINAQRQIGTGTLPKMEGVNSSMVDVIESCLRLEPDDRPTLSTIWTALCAIPDEAPAIVENEIVGTH